MPDTHTQEQAFEFFVAHFRSQDSFTKDEFRAAVPGWTDNSLRTYWKTGVGTQFSLMKTGDSPDYPRKWKDPFTNKQRLRLDHGHKDPKTGRPY